MLETIPPLAARAEVMEFFLTRRSRPARTLILPVPTRDQLVPILTAAARVPDHGKLEPWRFVVLERPALARLAGLAAERGAALGLEEEKRLKGVAQFSDAHLAIAVVKCPRPTDRIPEIEQVLSTGAVCMTLLNAAAAAGWGGNWLTGWALADEDIHPKQRPWPSPRRMGGGPDPHRHGKFGAAGSAPPRSGPNCQLDRTP